MSSFRIFKNGESVLEDINQAGTFKLMVQDDDIEIFESNIHAGRSILCQPNECEDSINAVFVISGKLYRVNTKEYILPGDRYTFKDLKDTHHLDVIENSKLLMIRKKGFFVQQVTKTKKISDLLNRINEKDEYTQEHCNRTGNIATQIAMALNLSEETIENVMYVGKIHDIGKVEIPIEILNKIETLTEEEFDLIKEHCTFGHNIVMETLNDESVAKIVFQHHEKFDGSGYPMGLKGDEITIEARIIMVADSFDAMTKDRPYREGMDVNKVIKELTSYAGTWYDKDVVDALVQVVEQKKNTFL